MVACYLVDTNKFLSYRTLCTGILKWGFPTKGIRLTRFVIFQVHAVPRFEVPPFRPFQQLTHENLRNTSDAVEEEILVEVFVLRNISLLVFPLPCADEKIQRTLYHDSKSSSNRLQLVQSWFVIHSKNVLSQKTSFDFFILLSLWFWRR